jgi:hypothetical protein
MSRKCGSLDLSQPYGPPWPVTGIGLPFTDKDAMDIPVQNREEDLEVKQDTE